MDSIPEPHALAVLALVVLALFLFSRGKIVIDTSSRFVLVLLTSGITAFPYISSQSEPLEKVKFFGGFGHEALVAVCALMIAGSGYLARKNSSDPAAIRGYSAGAGTQ